MLELIGAGIVVSMMIFAMFEARRGRIGAGWVCALVLVAALAGVAVANLPRVVSFAMQAGEHRSVNLQLQQVSKKAQQVQADASEVRQMKEQIEALVNRVQQGEENVSRMHGSMQQTWRSLYESFAYIAGTQNLTPPPKFISNEIVRHVNIIGEFAYPDLQERSVVAQKITENIKKAQAQKSN